MNVAARPDMCPQHLDLLSICAGGGGLDLGIGLALPGARSVCLVEREAFAVAHLVSAMEQGLLHPAPVWSDARTFDGRAWRGCVDGLVGGIPCQPHSLAGRKRGRLDERDLWSDARRIIVQSRCWLVLIENVGGMLAAGADEVAGAERVWRDLRKLGFRVEAGLFTARQLGAPQERPRVFILGVADSLCTGLQGGEWRTAPFERDGSPASRSTPELCEVRLFPPAPDDDGEWDASVSAACPQPAVRCLADGLAGTVPEWLRLLGNGVVPLAAGYALRTLATRLAARGSAGAARLVRMMEAAE